LLHNNQEECCFVYLMTEAWNHPWYLHVSVGAVYFSEVSSHSRKGSDATGYPDRFWLQLSFWKVSFKFL